VRSKYDINPGMIAKAPEIKLKIPVINPKNITNGTIGKTIKFTINPDIETVPMA
jgi:hypothetical protein